FRNGRVVSWSISSLNPLKAVLLPESGSDASTARAKGFFTVGSTKDEVIGVQGTPTRFSETNWTYGLSSVEFRAGTDAGWDESPLNPLRARLLPAVQADSAAGSVRRARRRGDARDLPCWR